jgi:ribosomal protein S3AE
MAILKKRFFEIEIPLTNSKVDLLAYTLESLDGKSIKLDLTRQLRGKSIEVVLKVKVKEGKASALPVKLTLLPFFIRRMLRKNISYVEDSFVVECTDAQVRIKPFLITRKRVSRRVRKALRDETKNWLEAYSADKSYNLIFSDIVGNRLQKPLSLKLKKIYPLALCEIRVLKVERIKEQEELKIKTEKIKEKEGVKEIVKQEEDITDKEAVKEQKAEEAEEEIIKEEKPKKPRKKKTDKKEEETKKE